MTREWTYQQGIRFQQAAGDEGPGRQRDTCDIRWEDGADGARVHLRLQGPAVPLPAEAEVAGAGPPPESLLGSQRLSPGDLLRLGPLRVDLSEPIDGGWELRMACVSDPSSERGNSAAGTAPLDDETLATSFRLLAHRLNNLMQRMEGAAYLMDQALLAGDLDLARESWPTLPRNLDQLSRLLNSLLASGKSLELESIPLDLPRLARAAQEAVTRGGSESLIAPNATAAAATASHWAPVLGDPHWTQRALENLLILAIFNRQPDSEILVGWTTSAAGSPCWELQFAPDPDTPPWSRLDERLLTKADLERGRLEWHSASRLLAAQGFQVTAASDGVWETISVDFSPGVVPRSSISPA